MELKPSTSDVLRHLNAEAERMGWYADCNLDYEFSTRYGDQLPEDLDDFDLNFVPVWGESEGIYIDAFYSTASDRWVSRRLVGCCKTLDDSLESFEAMGRLAGRLTWLMHKIDWEKHFKTERP